MTFTAFQPMLVWRRHVDLLRTASAVCLSTR